MEQLYATRPEAANPTPSPAAGAHPHHQGSSSLSLLSLEGFQSQTGELV